MIPPKYFVEYILICLLFLTIIYGCYPYQGPVPSAVQLFAGCFHPTITGCSLSVHSHVPLRIYACSLSYIRMSLFVHTHDLQEPEWLNDGSVGGVYFVQRSQDEVP